MKKRNKILEFLKNNWYFVLLVIPFVFFSIRNKTPDNDIWFLMNNGRYVINNGIPHIDPFTIHEGLHYVMQQWLSYVIFYSIYNTFGKHGLWGLMIFIYLVLVVVLYNINKYISKNKFYSVIVEVIVMSMLCDYLVTRPQVFSYIILLLETYCLEKYYQEDNWKYLIFLPILSVLLINMHSAIWFLQYVFMLPFIVNILVKDKNKWKRIGTIGVVLIIMFIVGFINPYGIEAITYLFKSYGIKDVNHSIMEMIPSNIEYPVWFLSILLFLLYVYVAIYHRKKKVEIRYFLFLIGTFILALLHKKCISYYLLWYSYAAMGLYFKIDIFKKMKNNKYYISIKNGLIVGLSLSLLVILGLTIKTSYSVYSMRDRNEEVIDYLLDNYDVEDIKLYASFNDGGYAEYRNIKVYMDPRAELFFKKMNGKYDIFSESYTVENYPTDEEIEDFLSKYHFTHLMVYFDTTLEKYLKNSDKYQCIYTKYFDDDKSLPLVLLYVNKE